MHMLDETTLMIFAIVTEWIIADLILIPTAYRAFKLRAVLRNRFSRSQALWLGIVAIFMVPILPLPFPNPNLLIDIVASIEFAGVFPIVLVVWVDGAVRAARRFDPLYRDTLAWSKLRVIIWPVTIAAAALNFGLLTLESLTGLPVATVLTVALALAPILPPFLAGAPALLLLARRTTSGARRASAKWFALFYLFQVASIVTTIATFAGTTDPQSVCGCLLYFLGFNHGIYAIGWNLVQITFIISGYSLYRYAGSLAQLNRIPLSDEAEGPEA